MWERRPLGIVLLAPLEEEKTLNDGDAPGATGTLSGSRSRRADLQEGEVVAVGELSPREKQPQEDVTNRNLGKEGVVIHRWAIQYQQP
jgi:hypothetical protein